TAIAMFVKATKGGASGGTIASLINVIKESRADRSIARTLVDPYGLNPNGERDGPDRRDQQKALYDNVANLWTAPFVMATINTKVIRRSHALLDYPYGHEFRYREAIMTGPGIGGWFKATVISLIFSAAMLAVSYEFTRGLLERFVLTKPGDGPDKVTRETGFFDLRQYGTLADGSIIRSKIVGDRDPGYGSTSKMLAECAVCIAKDELGGDGGVLTPASAMGDALLGRLQSNAGLSFEILD
ncbi:MAG: saccharopine dehydrogenase, partial [Gammaproteobacteria bacterium]|nr:saccharopine dehydrogenase [Gammaproteobacteria bacterium]